MKRNKCSQPDLHLWTIWACLFVNRRASVEEVILSDDKILEDKTTWMQHKSSIVLTPSCQREFFVSLLDKVFYFIQIRPQVETKSNHRFHLCAPRNRLSSLVRAFIFLLSPYRRVPSGAETRCFLYFCIIYDKLLFRLAPFPANTTVSWTNMKNRNVFRWFSMPLHWTIPCSFPLAAT